MTRYRCLSCGGDQYSADPSKANEPCIYCGNRGTAAMKDLMPDKDEDITELTKEQASEIIETRTPTGLFYTKENGLFIGIDNSRGGAWTEEFKHWDVFKLWITTQMTVEEAEKITGRRRSNVSIRNQSEVIPARS